MSTVLTKPVLLDETGQAIVGKLDEIKEAIDNGGTEKYPVLIHITTMPTKTSYIAGEQLNLAGMVVKAVFSNNVEYDVTDQCTFSPANGTVLTSSDTSVTATYTWHPTGTSFTATQAISVKGIVGISVATPPTKTDYIINETLDLTGMVVHLDYDDNTYDDITADCTYVPTNGATLDDDTLTAVAISYVTELGTTLTASQAISVIIPIYGVEWDGTATNLLTRTDLAADFVDPIPSMSDGNGGWTEGSSPFDNIWPWSGIEIDTTLKSFPMVKIPKFYYKWTQEGSSLKLQISPVQLEGFHVSPAHANRLKSNTGAEEEYTGEPDFVYISRAISSKVSGFMVGGEVKQTVISDISASSYGDGYYISDYAMWWTINMLYLVEFANWNSKATIGMGNSPRDAQYRTYTATGGIGQMPYHTGCTGTSKSEEGSAQYRWIINWWGAAIEYCANIRKVANSSDFYSYTGIDNHGTYTKIATFSYLGSSTDPIRSWSSIPTTPGLEFALTPDSVGGSVPSYVSDTCVGMTSNTSSTLYLSTGGDYIGSEGYGAFYQKWQPNSLSAAWRLMYIPTQS